MALLKSIQETRKLPVPNADRAIEDIPIFADYTATGTEATGDVLEMVPLPAGYVPVDVCIDYDKMAGTAFTADVGIMSGNYDDTGTRTCSAVFMTGKTLGAAAGVARADVSGFSRIAPTTNIRGVGLNLTTVTGPTAGAKLRLTLWCRPAIESA